MNPLFRDSDQDQDQYLDDQQSYEMKKRIIKATTQKQIYYFGIENDVLQIFQTKYKDENYFSSKMSKINKKVIINLSKIEIPQQKQQKAEHQKKVSEIEQKVLKQIPIEKLPQKKKQLQQKKITIKNKYKVNFKNVIKQNQMIFSAQHIDADNIEKRFKNKNHSFVNLKFEKVQNPNHGQASYKYMPQVDRSKIKDELLKISSKMDEIAKENQSLCSSEFARNIEKYKDKLKNYFDMFEDQKQILQQNQIDIAIIMDTTGSMGQCLDKAQTDSKQIIKNFKKINPNCSINFSFISYKDHCDKKVVEVFDFDTAENIQRKIQAIQAMGGGDPPEAVHDGLYAVKDLTWRKKSVKFVFLIFDAPPHGKQYNQDPYDNYPEGCPCKITLKQIADYYSANFIHINVKQIGTFLKQTNTSKIFKSTFRQDLFSVSDLEATHFSTIIAQDMNKKMKEIRQLFEKTRKQFIQMVNEIIKAVNADVQNIIKTEQQLASLKQYENEINELKSFNEDVKQVKKIEKLDENTQNISTIKQKIVLSFQTATKIKKLKQQELFIRKKVQEMIKNNNLEGLIDIFKDRVLYAYQGGDSKYKIIQTFVHCDKIPESIAEKMVETILKRSSEKVRSSSSQIKSSQESTLKSVSQIKSIIEKKQESKIQDQSMIKDNNIEGLSERYKNNDIDGLVKKLQRSIIGRMTKQKQQDEIIQILIQNNEQLEGKEQLIKSIIEKVFNKNYGQEIQQKKIDFEEEALRSSQRINVNQRIVEHFINTYGISRNLARKYTEKYLQR